MEQHSITVSYGGKSHLFQVIIDQLGRTCSCTSRNGDEALFDRDGEGKLHLVYLVGMLDKRLVAIIASMIEKVFI